MRKYIKLYYYIIQRIGESKGPKLQRKKIRYGNNDILNIKNKYNKSYRQGKNSKLLSSFLNFIKYFSES